MRARNVATISRVHASRAARAFAKFMLAKIGRLGVRAIIAAAILWLIATAPIAALDWQLVVVARVPIAIFIFIAYIGKLLYDTFFYDRTN